MKDRFIFIFLLQVFLLKSQSESHKSIPKVLGEFTYQNCQLTLSKNGQQLRELDKRDNYNYDLCNILPVGKSTGIEIDLKKPNFSGSIAYGPINLNSEFPKVLFFPKVATITDGKAILELKSVLTKANDFYHLANKSEGLIGYRIFDQSGRILYEGRCAFKGNGPYEVIPTIFEGPFINDIQDNGCIISYETQIPMKTKILIDNLIFSDTSFVKHHEIKIDGLKPSKSYMYKIICGDCSNDFSFKTAPKPGSRLPFAFAFASANRANTGGGEHDFGGTNYQSTKKIMASAYQHQVAFLLSMGDITNGGNVSNKGHFLEYANFKRALEPFWSKIPVYIGYGDHEVNYYTFEIDTVVKKSAKIDRFPYATESGEACFAEAFVHPKNGPESEDGSIYDPNKDQVDFPTYKENVYSFIYDNVAMIVLNTEYWKGQDPKISGSPEGYIMDKQLQWLKEKIEQYEKDPAIDHIFVNLHSAVFPNGDHANGAMWYDGNNAERPKVAGKKVSKGILERRDELLDICVNNSQKFLAFISGDEHNFAFLKVDPEFPVYPKDYAYPTIKLKRSFYHINNGGGGSAAYAMLPTPWQNKFQFFTEPPVLGLMKIKGKLVSVSAIDAETLAPICQDIMIRN